MFETRQKRSNRQRGQAMVEGGLVFAVCAAVLFGLMEFGRAVWVYNLVCHGAREGTRYAIVRGRSNPYPATATGIRNLVLQRSVGLNPARTTVDVTWLPDNNPGSYVRVAVRYNFNFIAPFVPRNALSLRSTSQMIISN